MHPMHSDDNLGIKYICDEFKFAHRKKTYQSIKYQNSIVRFATFFSKIKYTDLENKEFGVKIKIFEKWLKFIEINFLYI